MTGIFMSYSRKDSAVAQKLIKEFESIDLDVWVDWEDIPPAVGWLDQILHGIEQADAFVFLLSPDSVASEVCKVELNHARKNAKRIIPIVVRDVNPKDLEQFIRDLNWIFIRETDDLAVGIGKVKIAINIDVEWLQEHRRLQVRALEWDRAKDTSLLLRGRDLRRAAMLTALNAKKDPTPSDLQRQYIEFSRRDERIRTLSIVSAAIALLIMALLSLLAFNQRQVALTNANIAQEQKAIAEKNEKTANSNARAAIAAKAAAETNATIAQSQRSAARAQIYQSRPGGLFTSTLLAIDSYRRKPSEEAEDILRKNISLLPAPIKQIKQDAAILNLEVSPNGTSFVASSKDGSACLIRFVDGEKLYCLTSPGSMLDAVFSPDGSILVTSDSTGEVQVANAETGQVLKKLNIGVAVRSVTISPNGSLLALARDDSRITLIKLSNYEYAGEFSVYGSLRVTSFSPNGVWFAAGSDTGSITFWNLETGKIVSGSVHRGEVLDIVFSPDSRELISGGTDNYAVKTSPSTGKQLLHVLNEDWVSGVDYGPDGKWFVTASNDFRIRVWDAGSGEERLRLLQDSFVNEVKASPNGLWIASTGADRTVRVWNTANGAEMFQIPLENAGQALAFSPDDHYLVTGDADGYVSIWDISALDSAVGFLRFDGFVGNIKISPQGDWFAASADGQAWVLPSNLYTSQTTPQSAPILDFEDDPIKDMAIHPEGNLIAVTTESGKVALYNREQRSVDILIESGPARKLLFSPDGEKLILAGEDGLLQYRNLNGGGGGIIWQAGTALYAVAVSSEGLLAVGHDDEIVLLDLKTGELLALLKSPGRNQMLEFNAAGDVLASTTLNGITLWQREEGEYKAVASLQGNPPFSMAFDPEGNRLILGQQDQVLLINSHTGKELYRIRQKGNVDSLAFSSDGKTLLASSLRTILFFDVSSFHEFTDETLLPIACSHLTRNFTQAEWSSFFAEEKYQAFCESLP